MCHLFLRICQGGHLVFLIRLGYCFTPHQRLWLYNGAPLVAFYDTLGIRRVFLISPKKTNLVEDVEILLPVMFH